MDKPTALHASYGDSFTFSLIIIIIIIIIIKYYCKNSEIGRNLTWPIITIIIGRVARK
jgi:hypothetical protein